MPRWAWAEGGGHGKAFRGTLFAGRAGAGWAVVRRTGSGPAGAAGRGADRPSYFEAMSAAVTRGWAPLRGVLVGREKYIELPIVELYDLARDPKEATNIVQARTDRAHRVFGVAAAGKAVGNQQPAFG